MKKRAPLLARKLVVLLGAYGSLFLVLLCIQLGFTSSQWDSKKQSRSVCDGPAFSLLRFKEEPRTRFQAHQLENVEFQRHVQEVLRPQPHHIENYVFKDKWQAYDGSRQVSKTDTDVVLLLQASPDRLPFVRQVAQRWQGPISLAVYIPAPAHSDDAARCNATVRTYLQHRPRVNFDHPFAVSFLYANGLVPNLGCDLNPESTGFEEATVDRLKFDRRFGKSSGYKATWENVLPAEYPINALRTAAKEQIKSNVFVFPSEAGFMPTNNMHSTLRRGSTGTLLSEAREAWNSLEERRAVIVPAFQRLSHNTMRQNREQALNETGGGIEVEFDVPGLQKLSEGATAGNNAQGQQQSYLGLWGWGQEVACADRDGSSPVTLGSSCWTYKGYSIPLTKRRLQAMIRNGSMTYFHESSFPQRHRCYDPYYWLENSQPYEVSVRSPCEPYFIALRSTLPRFDPRFRGNLRDRVSVFSQMAQMGTRFFVSADNFITHLPHPPAVPLAVLSGDSKITKYALVIPYVMTQIMLEEMRFMAQMAYSADGGAAEASQTFRSVLQETAHKSPPPQPPSDQMYSRSLRREAGKLLLSAEAAGSSDTGITPQSGENDVLYSSPEGTAAIPATGILSSGRVKVKPKQKSLTSPLLRFFYPDTGTASSDTESDSQPFKSTESDPESGTLELESASEQPSPRPSLDSFWTFSNKMTIGSRNKPSHWTQPPSTGQHDPQDRGDINASGAPVLNSNLSSGGPSDSDFNSQSGTTDSNSNGAGSGISSEPNKESESTTKNSNTGPWETRSTPQAAFASSPSRSWMQEIRGHFRRGGVKVWGEDVEKALSEGWPELAAVSVNPECTIDWASTAAAFVGLFFVLGTVAWAVMRLI